MAIAPPPTKPAATAEDVRRKLEFTTVKIERDNGSGTGFIFTFDPSDNTAFFIVTNRHVVEGTKRLKFRLTKSKGGDAAIGDTCLVEVDAQGAWFGHPDLTVDLAIIPLNTPSFSQATIDGKPQGGLLDVHVCWINPRDIPSAKKMAELTSASDILMVGYPIGLADDLNYKPLFRRGITATSPTYDYNGKPQFVVDLACFPGSSGSPVFSYTPPLPLQSSGLVEITNNEAKVKLIGVLWGGPPHHATGNIAAVPIPTAIGGVAVTAVPSHLGYAIKAHEILAFEAILNALKPAAAPQIVDAAPMQE